MQPRVKARMDPSACGSSISHGVEDDAEAQPSRAHTGRDVPIALENTTERKQCATQLKTAHRSPLPPRGPADTTALQRKLSDWRRRMELKNIGADMTGERAKSRFFQGCGLCGKTPTWSALSGIDCLANDIPCFESNSLAACARCSLIKGEHDLEAFIRLAGHRGKEAGRRVGPELTQDQLPSSFGLNHEQAEKSVTNDRGLHFDAPKPALDEITSNPCYPCGKKPGPGHTNSIDRVRPNDPKQYSGDNIDSCCSPCNFAKGNLTAAEFEAANAEVWRKVGFLVAGRPAADHPQKQKRRRIAQQKS